MRTVILFFSLMLAVSLPARATVVIPLSLQQVSERASLIFQGKVTDVDVRFDEVSQRVATYTTFAVQDVIKGEAGATHTVKQVGGQLPGSQFALRIHGVPRFNPGEEYVVFLPAPSRLGFASPVGLSQGAFSVVEKNGVQVVSNHYRSGAATSTARPAASAAGKAARATSRFTALDDFKSTIRNMVAK